MEHLLPTMLILAIYYTVADSILIFQVFFYRTYSETDETSADIAEIENQIDATLRTGSVRNQRISDGETAPLLGSTLPPLPPVTLEEEEQMIQDDILDSVSIEAASECCLMSFCNPTLVFLQASLWLLVIGSYVTIKYLGVAQWLGWCSALLYVGSRIPQIAKNHRNKSTQGLSPYMFIFAIAGNSLYIASIFLESTERFFLMKNLPWIVGSAGTLALDMYIGVQFVMYKVET